MERKLKADRSIAVGEGAWTFDGIEDDFELHIARSIPHYLDWQNLICRLSDYFITGETVVYDIGTATGALARRLGEFQSHKEGVRIVGIDPVASMIEKARSKTDDKRIEYVCEDIRAFQLEKSSLITSYYTMQFIHPNYRQDVVNKIYESLLWGGGFICFEKVRGADARFQDYMSQIYSDFKLENDFSPDEVLGKTKSLKGVLEPFSSEGNRAMLERAGFKDIMPVARWLCFEGILAIK